MPNLGAGVDQHVNTAPVPTWVYQPPANQINSPYPPAVRLYNEGTNLLYVGGKNVSPYNGLPLPPNGRPLEISNAQFGTIYTCSNAIVGNNTAACTLSSAVAAGSTTLLVGAAFSTSIVAGSVIILANSGAGYEVLVVASTAAGTITTTTATLYDHANASAGTLATTTPGQLRVTAGVA